MLNEAEMLVTGHRLKIALTHRYTPSLCESNSSLLNADSMTLCNSDARTVTRECLFLLTHSTGKKEENKLRLTSCGLPELPIRNTSAALVLQPEEAEDSRADRMRCEWETCRRGGLEMFLQWASAVGEPESDENWKTALPEQRLIHSPSHSGVCWAAGSHDCEWTQQMFLEPARAGIKREGCGGGGGHPVVGAQWTADLSRSRTVESMSKSVKSKIHILSKSSEGLTSAHLTERGISSDKPGGRSASEHWLRSYQTEMRGSTHKLVHVHTNLKRNASVFSRAISPGTDTISYVTNTISLPAVSDGVMEVNWFQAIDSRVPHVALVRVSYHCFENRKYSSAAAGKQSPATDATGSSTSLKHRDTSGPWVLPVQM
ncbi:hypothetical protein DNTS_018846 [Danionella cerebrum]|uniref:Uncharacterized protein n=1 Tax=Danionella cerebrum TaxID=2873325 RepID=A0A553QN86_9TELE|nr:hypothetical protein DNTS_018846 [Danionella translucida]